MNSQKFVRHILKKNGVPSQAVETIEKMGVLTQELTRFVRGDLNRERLGEEISSVILCLRQMKEAFQIDDLEVEQRIQDQIDRYEREAAKGKEEEP